MSRLTEISNELTKQRHLQSHTAKIFNKLPRSRNTALQALSLAAIALPGLLPLATMAAEGDEVDLQYTHYQESKRDIYTAYTNSTQLFGKVPNHYQPIEADSLHGHSKMALSDRIHFAFDYTQDTWSGATPIATAPAVFAGNITKNHISNGVVTGASPFIQNLGGYVDKQLNPLFATKSDPDTGLPVTSIINRQLVHTLSYASPETRKQGNFKLGYEWDEAAVDLGGGLSLENDYESRFANLGSRLDFNQKQTTLNAGLSYTNSTTQATTDPKARAFMAVTERYANHVRFIKEKIKTLAPEQIRGNREDWSGQLSLSQVLSKNALLEGGFNYTRSNGYMANPYKVTEVMMLSQVYDANGNLIPDIYFAGGLGLIEQRPELRNQFNWNARYVQYVEPLDAALHLGYQFFHDDWGINAHTFDADWGQPLGSGWTLTPRVRYYSQSAADFYHPYLTSFDKTNRRQGSPFTYIADIPANFSSDQRLSAYGTLSGGITLTKQFAKGVELETGAEYYSHAGSLKLGGGGEGSYADFNYWVANATLKLNLDSLGRSSGSSEHSQHNHAHSQTPAGVMFGHMLAEAGDTMLGYRYMYNQQGGEILRGSRPVGDAELVQLACPEIKLGCHHKSTGMTMHMHMLDLMVAPTDWLTLMVMPQFWDMDMAMMMPSGAASSSGHNAHLDMFEVDSAGGFGDTGLYLLGKLYKNDSQELHLTLGVSAPTGNVNVKDYQTGRNSASNFTLKSYDMQLGSGTWDFKPSLTYNGETEDWLWGSQINGTKRLQNQNQSRYVLGDNYQTTAWGGYKFTHWLSASIRGIYTAQDPVSGQGIKVSSVAQAHSSFFAANTGGEFGDVGFGLSATVPSGSFAGHRLAVEWLQPVYTHYNGYQLARDFALSANWSMGF